MKSSFRKLEEIRTEAQLLVISMDKLKDSCADVEIPAEVLDKLNMATQQMELFRREVSARLLVERGVLDGPSTAEE